VILRKRTQTIWGGECRFGWRLAVRTCGWGSDFGFFRFLGSFDGTVAGVMEYYGPIKALEGCVSMMSVRISGPPDTEGRLAGVDPVGGDIEAVYLQLIGFAPATEGIKTAYSCV